MVTNLMDKKTLKLIGGNGTLGCARLAPLGVPKACVAALRAVFKMALNDPAVAAAAAKRKMTYGLVTLQAIQAHTKKIGSADNALFVRVRRSLKRNKPLKFPTPSFG